MDARKLIIVSISRLEGQINGISRAKFSINYPSSALLFFLKIFYKRKNQNVIIVLTLSWELSNLNTYWNLF